MIIKGASFNKGSHFWCLFHPDMMKKTIFKIIGKFSENAFIWNTSKVSDSANIRRVIVFLICCIMKTTCQLKFVEKIHLWKFYGKKLWFSPKIYAWLPSYDKTLQSYSLLTDKITPIKLFQQHLLFTRKESKQNVAFLNVLSIHVCFTALIRHTVGISMLAIFRVG